MARRPAAKLGRAGSLRRCARGAPIAKQSPSAWLAAIWPNRKGSSTMARKKSTDCTSTWPAGSSSTAPSSGNSRPTSTPAGCACCCCSTWLPEICEPSACATLSRRSTRLRLVAPSLLPHPPHRMLALASSASSSADSHAAVFGCCCTALAGRCIAAKSSSEPNLAMNARSIWSFHAHSQLPCIPARRGHQVQGVRRGCRAHACTATNGGTCSPSQPLVPTAYLPPAEMSDKKVVWGVQGFSGLPARARRRFSVSGAPCKQPRHSAG